MLELDPLSLLADDGSYLLWQEGSRVNYNYEPYEEEGDLYEQTEILRIDVQGTAKGDSSPRGNCESHSVVVVASPCGHTVTGVG